MSEKLLPCPFCGGEASAEQCVRVDYYGDWVVGCDNEQCRAKPEVLAAIKSAAIAAWNRRTLLKAYQEQRRALEDLLALPVAAQAFVYLDKGIGTKTPDAAWLRARAALNQKGDER